MLFDSTTDGWQSNRISTLSMIELDKRANSFQLLIYHQSREQLCDLLDLLHDGIFGARPQSLMVRKVGIRIERALKILTCAAIQLCAVENAGADSAKWVVSFLFRSLVHADAKCHEPRSRFIIEQVGSLRTCSMIASAARIALNELGIEDQIAIDSLAGNILNASSSRLYIMKMALLDSDSNLSRKNCTNFLTRLAATTNSSMSA